MDFILGERLFHILVPWSNIEFLEICSLNGGVLVERLLRVSYVCIDMNLLCWNTLGIVLFRFLNINIEA